MSPSESAAFLKLVERSGPDLASIVRRRVRPAEEAAEILQDIWVSAWAALPSRPADQPLEPWLIAIALNKCRDWARRSAVRVRAAPLLALPPETPCGAESALIREESLALLSGAIARLPASLRSPLELSALEEMTQADVARRLGVSVKAVETRVRRARQNLRAALEPALA